MTATDLVSIPNLIRCESTPMPVLLDIVSRRVQDSYSHDTIYGFACNLQMYIAARPVDVFSYLSDVYSLEEYTYSVRGLQPFNDAGVYVGQDTVAPETTIYVHTVANVEAGTIDYRCAWDQPDELWMVYLFRVLDASDVLGRPGTVITWTNMHHRYYDENPYPDRAPDRPDRFWVGELWPQFHAGHSLELENIKAIMEARHPEPGGDR
ncbi:SRPBCC family protein [Pseudonocardia sp. SCN 73-27]|uniref:SRPBCC family protein n=1 Tax=Pseudonocardia sp. SCN 73-27 TaxID=1660132 RepID=UPI000AC04591|nr:SRPBCC family protein [Pseudonocardia sp. SCN 73-27]